MDRRAKNDKTPFLICVKTSWNLPENRKRGNELVFFHRGCVAPLSCFLEGSISPHTRGHSYDDALPPLVWEGWGGCGGRGRIRSDRHGEVMSVDSSGLRTGAMTQSLTARGGAGVRWQGRQVHTGLHTHSCRGEWQRLVNIEPAKPSPIFIYLLQF